MDYYKNQIRKSLWKLAIYFNSCLSKLISLRGVFINRLFVKFNIIFFAVQEVVKKGEIEDIIWKILEDNPEKLANIIKRSPSNASTVKKSSLQTSESNSNTEVPNRLEQSPPSLRPLKSDLFCSFQCFSCKKDFENTKYYHCVKCNLEVCDKCEDDFGLSHEHPLLSIRKSIHLDVKEEMIQSLGAIKEPSFEQKKSK